jgi:hypothetical protein
MNKSAWNSKGQMTLLGKSVITNVLAVGHIAAGRQGVEWKL